MYITTPTSPTTSTSSTMPTLRRLKLKFECWNSTPIFLILANGLALILSFGAQFYALPAYARDGISATSSNSSVAGQPLSIKVIQESKLAGKGVLYLSSKGIRVENHDGSLITVAAAPTWVVYRFNPFRKAIFIVPLSRFSNRLASLQPLTGSTVLTHATVRKTGEEKFLDFAVENYSASSEFVAYASVQRSKEHNVSASYPQTFSLKAFSVKDFPEQEAHVVSVLFGTPDIPEVVLDLSCLGFDLRKYKFVAAEKIEAVRLPDNFFQPPSDFRHVAGETELTGNVNDDLLQLIR